MATPQKFQTPGFAGVAESTVQQLNDNLNPFGNLPANQPFWSSGARSFIRIAGRPIGVAQSFSWSVSYVPNPIVTVDTPHAWDIDVGQMSCNATLGRIMDPTGGPESDAMFHIMSAAIHQPYVELQVLDALGTSLFFARGMFLAVNGQVARGQLSNISAQFVGVAYQHYVNQTFKPYDSIAGGLQGLANGLKNLASTATGGIL